MQYDQAEERGNSYREKPQAEHKPRRISVLLGKPKTHTIVDGGVASLKTFGLVWVLLLPRRNDRSLECPCTSHSLPGRNFGRRPCAATGSCCFFHYDTVHAYEKENRLPFFRQPMFTAFLFSRPTRWRFSGKSHHPQTRTRDRFDSQSTAPEGAGDFVSMPGSVGSTTTGGSAVHGGVAMASAGTAVYSYGAGVADGGGGGWRRRNFVGSAGAASRAGYGFLATTDLEPGMSGDRRALWTCFCSFKTRRKRCVFFLHMCV